MFENEFSLFRSAVEELAKEISSSQSEKAVDAFKNVFDSFTEIHKVENSYIYVISPDALTKFKAEKFYGLRLNEIIKLLSNNTYGIKFIEKEEAIKEKAKQVPLVAKESIDPRKTKRSLRSEFTFSNFVVGESNRFAYSEAMQVANSPYAIFNPLYIMGSVGLGKTHLMMSIGHYVLDNNINANVIYTSATQFADDYFRATSSKNPDAIVAFNNQYQSADLLLVDDIQFLENKEKTQEQFFKCFDYLHENNKQIVVTSDRPANELKIMERLKSRFAWGEIVEIKTPDLNLRVNILKRKLSFLIKNPQDVSDEVLIELASYFKDNVRELEGALRTFINYCVSFNYPFNKEYLIPAVGTILPKNESNIETQEIKKLKDIICSFFSISSEDLESSSRISKLVYARNLAFYILREDYQLQLKDIGNIFGGRDHTTVAHGYEKIKMDSVGDQGVISDLKYIRKKLKD